jgi:serine-type D-Ala-D-Ala carboxypeptidase (penicillin-binding protein 5/6)
VKVGLVSSISTNAAVVVAVPAGTSAQVTSVVTRADPLVAPITKGQNIVTLKVAIGNQPWQVIPLQAKQDVALAGWLGRAWDGMRLWFH